MAKLVIVRHGESLWNLQNRFAGWVDVGLSDKGVNEAMSCGEKLKDYRFDKVYVSHLIRAIHTMKLILEKSSDKRIPIIYHDDDLQIKNREHYSGNVEGEIQIFQSKALAERYYGDLQGLNKDETKKKYGEEQIGRAHV